MNGSTMGMRITAAITATLVALALLAVVTPRPLLAEDMMLNEESDSSPVLWGFTFLLLSAGSYYYATENQSDVDKYLDKADNYYDLYVAASSSTEATTYRNLTEKFHGKAEVAETRANVGYLLGTIFLTTSFYSFFPSVGDAPSLLISQNSVLLRVEF